MDKSVLLLLVTLGLFLLFGNVKCSEDRDGKSSDIQVSMKPSSYVELLEDNLLNQKWDEDEKPCYDQILNILTNVRNSTLWATWIWDSIQLPSGQFFGSLHHLGNFDQCLRKVWPGDLPVPTQYCLIGIKLADIESGRKLSGVNPYDTAESYLRIQTKFGYIFNVMHWGVCMPAVCQMRSVERFARTLYRLSHYGVVSSHPNVVVQHCQTSQTATSSTGLNVLMLIAAILVGTACTCTYFTMRYSEAISHSRVMKIVCAFDLKSNAANLLSTAKEEIRVMHGIRFLTACLVVFVHLVFIYMMSTAANGFDINDYEGGEANDFKDAESILPGLGTKRYSLASSRHISMARNTLKSAINISSVISPMSRSLNGYGSFIASAGILVDTYFLMSGLLLMKSFKPEMGRPINPIKLIIKRYSRLVWVYIIAITLIIFASPDLCVGPLWSMVASNEREPCTKSWWVGLLMVGNYIEPNIICLPITWYVPVDFQLTAFSTVMYWLYQRSRRGGLLLFGSVAVVSLLLPGLETYTKKLNPLLAFDVKAVRNYRQLITPIPTYVYTHFRATPYFLGLVVGYVLSVYKPANHRNFISTKQSTLIFIVSAAICVQIIRFGSTFHFREYDAPLAALFAALNRTVWAALIAALIFVCEYGNLPIVSDFLGWSAFVPLSKLSYGLYMLHYIFAVRLVLFARSSQTYDFFRIILETMGIVAVTCLLSLCIFVFFEAPLNNLVELSLRTKNDSNDTIEKKNNGTSAKKKI